MYYTIGFRYYVFPYLCAVLLIVCFILLVVLKWGSFGNITIEAPIWQLTSILRNLLV